MNNIHPTAIVHSCAQLAGNVTVGPHTVIEADVTIGRETHIMARSYVAGHTTVGDHCAIHMGAIIGHVPQDLAFDPKTISFVSIGSHTIIREYVTIHRGTKPDSSTKIGNHCFIMANSHVAHNCHLDDHVILTNGALLAGYVSIGHHAFISGLVAVHQFVRIGSHVIISGHSAVNKDIPPYMLAGGRPCAVWAVNVIGLRRAGFSKDRIEDVKKYYKIIFREGHNTTQTLSVLKREPDNSELQSLVQFIESSERGLCIGSGIKDRH